MSPSTSASRRPRSSCCPSPTAISRRLPPPGSRTPMSLPTLRLASLKRLRHPMSVDLYVESVVAQRAHRHRALPGRPRLLALRLRAHRRHRARARRAVRGPAGRRPRRSAARRRCRPWPPSRWRCSTVSSAKAAPKICGRRCATSATLLGRDLAWTPPVPVGPITVARARRRDGPPGRAGRLLSRQPDGGGYRADHRADGGARPRRAWRRSAVAVSSLKDPAIRARAGSADRGAQARDHPQHHGLLGACASDDTTVLDAADVPVLQVVLSGSARAGVGRLRRAACRRPTSP